MRAVLVGQEYLRPTADHHRADSAVVLLDGVALDLDGRLVDVDAALIERLTIGEDVLAGAEPDDLGAEELAVAEEGDPTLGVPVAPHHDLRLERLAVLHLLRQHHRLGHDLLGEGQRRRHVVDVGAGVLGRLGARQRVAGVLTAVGQHHDPVGVTGRQRGQRELDRLEDVGAVPAHLRLRPIDARPVGQRLVDDGFLAEHDDAVTVAAAQMAHRLRHEAIRALARGQADAVGEIEQEDDVLAIHPPGQHRPRQREREQEHEAAAQRQRPPVPCSGRQHRAAAGLSAPVEQPFQGEQQDRQHDEERPEVALHRLRRGRLGAGTARRRQRAGRQVRLVGVHQVDGHSQVSTDGGERVEADLVGLGEADRAARDRRLHGAAARRRDGGRGDAVGDRQEDRLPGGHLQARLVERGRMQPAQRVGQDQREGHAQREVGLEQIEADDDRLAVLLLERVDQRAADRLDQRAPGRQRPQPQGVLDGDLGELDVAHDRVLPVPVHDRRLLDAAEDLDRDVGRHRVDEDEPAGADARRRRRVDDDHIGLAHAARVLVGRLHVEGDLGIGLEDLFQEQVAGADQRHRDLARRRQHRPRHVVGGKVVVDVQAGGHRAAAVVREGQHHRAAHARLERHRLLGQRAPVDLQRKVERL